VPGVFFFDNDAFFVDGVVQLKSQVSKNLTSMEPIPLPDSAQCDREASAANMRVVARPLLLQRRPWRDLKHDASASFDSSSPSDSAATPPLS
jgi:hypothetical protein